MGNIAVLAAIGRPDKRSMKKELEVENRSNERTAEVLVCPDQPEEPLIRVVRTGSPDILKEFLT